MKNLLLAAILIVNTTSTSYSQVDGDQMGAWYMFFWNTEFKDSKFGLQGDVQFRNWNIAGDLEQLLLRGGFTYKPNDQVLLTLGYGNITTGAFGDDGSTVNESRIYQEALISNKLSDWVRLKHRFRYEQRFTPNDVFRTRLRYNLFLTIPLSQKLMNPGGVYLAFYNELFVNAERFVGDNDIPTPLYDRNRFYGAVGYVLNKKTKMQLGIMNQNTNSWTKNQLQLSVHSKF